jgi:Fe-S-cluster containining protein
MDIPASFSYAPDTCNTLPRFISSASGQTGMKPLYERQPLCFSCTACGDCCSTGNDYYVYLTGKEADRIRRHLKLSAGWFRRRYLERLDNGELVAASSADGRCVFLDSNKQCKVYPVRPLQCRTYPFWPELAGDAKAWRAEARRCEGINRGTAVPVERIRRAFNACLVQEETS